MCDTMWTFEALDSLFFRDGRPMNAGESCWLESVFPPTGYTLQGAIRAAILDSVGADIKAFQEGKPCLWDGSSLNDEIGDGRNIGRLKLSGPFLGFKDTFLFPSPLDLVQQKESGKLGLLKPGTPALSDLASHPVKVPYIIGKGYKVVKEKYISRRVFESILNGEIPPSDSRVLVPLYGENEDLDTAALLFREYKVGLARDNATKQNKEGMLYVISKVRPTAELKICVKVSGVESGHQPGKDKLLLGKLGGEGKLALISVKEWKEEDVLPKAPSLQPVNGALRFKIVFTTSALMVEKGWLPKGFEECQSNGTAYWKGEVDSCKFSIISACIGKPVRICGWNLAERKPKALKFAIPAGSVYFCETSTEHGCDVLGLHGKHIGQETEYGFGHILIGKW